jgi:hypothetical protein
MAVYIRVGLFAVLLGIIAMWATTTVWQHEEWAREAVATQKQPYLEVAEDGSSVWRDFQSAVGFFRVRFPAYPQHANEVVPIPNTDLYLEYDIYVAEPDQNGSYMVSLINYPSEVEVTNPENVLQTVMNEMLLANPLNQLESVNLLQGETAVLLFDIRNQDVVIRSKAMMRGQTLYLLTVTQSVGYESDLDYQTFIESFEFMEAAASATAND